jgi:hypothetical protein
MPSGDQQGRPVVGGLPGRPAPSGAAPDAASAAAQLHDVDDALERVAALPVDAQVAVFTDLHQRLTAALAVTGAAAGPSDEPPGSRSGPSRPSR